MSVCCLRDYFIKIEDCQNNVIAVVKVLAENEKEAEVKALSALHKTQSISEVNKQEVKDLLETNQIDYVLDEEGDEADVDEIYEEDSEEEEEISEKFILHTVSKTGFVSDTEYSDQVKATRDAVNAWNEGDSDYEEVSVHGIKVTDSACDISEQTRIWYAHI